MDSHCWKLSQRASNLLLLQYGTPLTLGKEVERLNIGPFVKRGTKYDTRKGSKHFRKNQEGSPTGSQHNKSSCHEFHSKWITCIWRLAYNGKRTGRDDIDCKYSGWRIN